jgi:hypothetical protein
MMICVWTAATSRDGVEAQGTSGRVTLFEVQRRNRQRIYNPFRNCGEKCPPPPKSDTGDTVFVVNGGLWESWEATDPKLKKCLQPA